MNLYHALNRGVDKRTIFLDTQDYARFVHDMFEFNSTEPADSTFRRNMSDVRRRSLESIVTDVRKNRDANTRIVDIHGWCLMHNHYHLLLSERIENGISFFLKKLNGGYAKYFNERYKRTGTLFQGRTKRKNIDSDSYLLHILNYIHFNPLDTLENTHDWRSRKITDSATAQNHLLQYRWSSYLDYIGQRNFPSILTTSLFLDIFNNNYKNQADSYLRDIDTGKIQHLLLE